MHPCEKEILLLIIAICLILGIVFIYFFYSVLKYHKRDLKDKLEMIYGKDGILEEEKKRIGREIHDGISSGLAGIKLMIESLTANTEKEKQSITMIISSLDTALANYRTVLNGLMEINIRTKTLPEALTDYFDKHNSSSMHNSMQINYELNAELDYPIEKSNHLYRILQEVIANSSRHGKAEILRIEAYETEDHTIINCTDNGVGFDTEQIHTSTTGIGLNNIKYRAGIINALCEINAEINKGTQVTLKIPA